MSGRGGENLRDILKNLGRSRTRHPAGSAATGVIQGIPPELQKLSEISAYLGWKGGYARRIILWSIVLGCIHEIIEKVGRTRIRRPAGCALRGARFIRIPPDLPKISAIATYLGRKGGIPHLMILRPTA